MPTTPAAAGEEPAASGERSDESGVEGSADPAVDGGAHLRWGAYPAAGVAWAAQVLRGAPAAGRCGPGGVGALLRGADRRAGVGRVLAAACGGPGRGRGRRV